MRLPLRKSRRNESGLDARLVLEAEAFLVGDYRRLLESTDASVPRWAWLNRLAHGSLHRLELLAGGVEEGRPARRATASWRRAEGTLADELLAIVGSDADGLRELQLAVLVPLELELIESGAQGCSTPEDLLALTRSALRSNSR